MSQATEFAVKAVSMDNRPWNAYVFGFLPPKRLGCVDQNQSTASCVVLPEIPLGHGLKQQIGAITNRDRSLWRRAIPKTCEA